MTWSINADTGKLTDENGSVMLAPGQTTDSVRWPLCPRGCGATVVPDTRETRSGPDVVLLVYSWICPNGCEEQLRRQNPPR